MYLTHTLLNIQENLIFFTLHITLRPFEGKDILNHKIKVSNYVTYKIQSEHYTTCTTEPASDFYIKLYQFLMVTSVLLK